MPYVPSPTLPIFSNVCTLLTFGKETFKKSKKGALAIGEDIIKLCYSYKAFRKEYACRFYNLCSRVIKIIVLKFRMCQKFSFHMESKTANEKKRGFCLQFFFEPLFTFARP